jgi:hypothetical protein
MQVATTIVLVDGPCRRPVPIFNVHLIGECDDKPARLAGHARAAAALPPVCARDT